METALLRGACVPTPHAITLHAREQHSDFSFRLMVCHLRRCTRLNAKARARTA